MFGFQYSNFGFETAKDVLGVGSNTMAKLIDLGLISICPDDSNQRNHRYAGFDIESLTSARNRPLLIEDGQKALVCSMGIRENKTQPSLYMGDEPQLFASVLDEVRKNVPVAVWDQIDKGILKVTGHWRVSQEDTDFLVANRSIVVASYAGFILDGGHIEGWVPNVVSKSGGRCFIVKPFDSQDRYKYAHNYLASRKGPMNKVWTAEELKNEANPKEADSAE